MSYDRYMTVIYPVQTFWGFQMLARTGSSFRRPTSGTLANFDIEGRTFDIGISRYCSFNLRYRRSGNDLRYRVRYYNSISKVLTFDIECLKSDKRRYRRLKHSISTQYDIEEFFDIEYKNFDIDHRCNTISKKRRYRSSKRRYRYIPISKNLSSLDIDKFTFDIWIRYRSFVLRYRPSISVFLCWVLPWLL